MMFKKNFLFCSIIFSLSACATTTSTSSNSNVRHKPQPRSYYAEELPALEAEGRAIVKAAYEQEADIKNCVPAKVTEKEKQKALDELNAIRRAHQLDEVVYNVENDKYTSASALINAANGSITHYPKKTAKCYSENGAKGSRDSNLSIYMSSSVMLSSRDHAENTIDGQLIDHNVESLGHRAWLLNPFLKSISYGRASNFSNGYVDTVSVFIDDQKTQISDNSPNYVAYPYGNYSGNWFTHGWYSSFSVIADKENYWANNAVNYAKAKIRVRTESGELLKVTNVSFTKEGKNVSAGLPNLLKWKILGTKNGQKYMVNIDNVIVKGEPKNYEYWFEVK